ncbi:apoptosis-associated speck-like protein containing a CARD [Misgurnus anguillicaudatus]|uniref:apoptosis-associated speck-like protein containing a CARD n=1 Tax=Misgurnus anguillicaudatus TaxID=75329 RepID=UPI003CCFAE62
MRPPAGKGLGTPLFNFKLRCRNDRLMTSKYREENRTKQSSNQYVIITRKAKTMEKQDFVHNHHAALVSRVTSVLPIAYKLFQRNMLSQEVYSEIKAKRKNQDKMKLLLAAVTSGGPEVKSYFFNVLDYYEPFLVKDLEGECGKNPTWDSSHNQNAKKDIS